MKWLIQIKELLLIAGRYFNKPETKAALVMLADYVPRMLPYLNAGAGFIAGVTPTILDDIAIVFLRKHFPRLFDGSLTTVAELKLYTAAAIAALFADRFGLKENQARAVLELALLAQKVETNA